MQYAIYNIQIQYAVLNIPYAICNIQYTNTIYCIKYTICNIQLQYTVLNILYAIWYTQYTICNMLYAIYNIQYTIYNTKYIICHNQNNPSRGVVNAYSIIISRHVSIQVQLRFSWLSMSTHGYNSWVSPSKMSAN